MFKMKGVIVFLMVLMLVAEQVAAKYGKYDNSKTADDELLNSKTGSSRGIGISAWGLVFLILAGILLGVAAYYVAIFYPLLCKKERKYDRIELAAM